MSESSSTSVSTEKALRQIVDCPPDLEPFLSSPGSLQSFEHYTSGGSAEIPWISYTQTRLYTNVYLSDSGKVLLGYKKRGFGMHLYNGFGGKVEPDESVIDAAARELVEEAGISASLIHAGTLIFLTEATGSDWAFRIEIYRAEGYSGIVTETDEMRPEWFTPSDLPYDKMWEGDKYWIPLVLAKRRFIAREDFGKSTNGEGTVLRKWWIGVQMDETEQ